MAVKWWGTTKAERGGELEAEQGGYPQWRVRVLWKIMINPLEIITFYIVPIYQQHIRSDDDDDDDDFKAQQCKLSNSLIQS